MSAKRSSCSAVWAKPLTTKLRTAQQLRPQSLNVPVPVVRICRQNSEEKVRSGLRSGDRLNLGLDQSTGLRGELRVGQKADGKSLICKGMKIR